VYRYYSIPDVRDGLTELERTILYTLYEARKEYGDRHIPVALIWGRVVERLDVSHDAFMKTLRKVVEQQKAQEAPLPLTGPDDREEHRGGAKRTRRDGRASGNNSSTSAPPPGEREWDLFD
jgi:hypothetical protein